MDTDDLKPTPLLRSELLSLAAFTLVLFALASFSGRSITTHEAVHCQNVREMLVDHDWLIPHYGGRVWLERPPLPHWTTAIVVAVSGAANAEWPYRLAAALAGAAIAAQIGWIASVLFGRRSGLIAGAVFATTRTGFAYATGSECDIVLALLVTTVMTLFVRIEFVPRDGKRRWELLALFVVLGLTNMAKGLFFGMALAALPIVAFVLGQQSWASAKRYLSPFGILAFLAAALVWPLVAFIREPGVADLWASDYLGRLQSGFLREPIWYYLAALPWCLFPWSLAAGIGFVQSVKKARNPRSPERLLLVWALAPLVFLSIPHGKHHHYLLPVLAPWCIFAALAFEPMWAWLRALPRWLRHPAFSAGGAAAIGVVAVFTFRSRITATDGFVIGLIVLLAAYAGLFRWVLDRPVVNRAALGTCGLIAVAFLTFEFTSASYGDSYRWDRDFVQQVRDQIPDHEPLLVVNDADPLDGSWMLFYLPERTRLLHNLSFLLDESIKDTHVWVVGRGREMNDLSEYGTAEEISRSECSRALKTNIKERWALYRVKLDPHRPRVPTHDVKITPMQATGRAKGPYLAPAPTFASAP